MSGARSYRALVERIADVAPATRSLFLRLPEGGGMPFLPGQFVSLGIPAGEKPLVRAYSIASSPEEPELLEICLDLVPGGPGSSYLFTLAAGAEVSFTGPWGTFVLGAPPPAAAVFLAAGTGVAPLRPMLRAALGCREVRDLRLIHAVTDEKHLLYREEFAAWAAGYERFRFEPLLETPGDIEHAALVRLVERRYVVDETDRSRHFFVCGVGEVVPRLRDLLRGAGYERRAVHYEKW